jgi:hypothetical protein
MPSTGSVHSSGCLPQLQHDGDREMPHHAGVIVFHTPLGIKTRADVGARGMCWQIKALAALDALVCQ